VKDLKPFSPPGKIDSPKKLYLYSKPEGVPMGCSRISGFSKIYLISFRLLAK
jgi:hypothetical protein